jgi:hypothetical protein
MVARAAAPAKPELAKQGNGLRVIRYPHRTAKGTTVARNYKLGWVDDAEADRQFAIFQHHWGKMNGQGPAGVIAKMGKKPKIAPNKTARALVVKGDRVEINRKAREAYARKKDGAVGTVSDADLARVQDHIGVVAASLSAISTSVRMLQDMVTDIQKKRGVA